MMEISDEHAASFCKQLNDIARQLGEAARDAERDSAGAWFIVGMTTATIATLAQAFEPQEEEE